MNQEQQKAILTIALLAAFADGINDEREREQIRRLAETLADETGTPDLLALYQQVLLKRVKLMDAASVLVDPAYRQLAYEMAVGVCAVDGRTTEAERQFLVSLAHALSLESAATQPVQVEAENIADLRDAAAPVSNSATSSGATATPASPTVAAAASMASVPNVSETELD
ncbi:MAG: tellurite resistance TerB family protein, partial [Azovibrio sp.]